MTEPGRWQSYADRFAALYSDGADVDGEARFVDMMAQRGSTVLDAGCGSGRVAAALTGRGHTALGVDADAALVDIGRERYPNVPLLVADLAELTAESLSAARQPTEFDIIVCAGNVMVYLAPGSELAVLHRLAALTKPGGRLVFGFAAGREYTVAELDRDAAAAGLRHEHRFATWQADVHRAESDWSVSVFRKPAADT